MKKILQKTLRIIDVFIAGFTIGAVTIVTIGKQQNFIYDMYKDTIFQNQNIVLLVLSYLAIRLMWATIQNIIQTKREVKFLEEDWNIGDDENEDDENEQTYY